MKHFAMNSFSSWRASEEATLRIIFLREIFPLFWNLRMFSRLRWRFSFFALVRQDSREVVETLFTPKVETGAKAYEKKKIGDCEQNIFKICINKWGFGKAAGCEIVTTSWSKGWENCSLASSDVATETCDKHCYDFPSNSFILTSLCKYLTNVSS